VTIVPLTSLAHGAGCGCKLPAAALLPIVRDLPRSDDPRLLVGSATGDDAAVFRLSDELALVQTIDFFTPIVDDPYDFGRIAAANALSDVYAMAGRPLTAMNVVAFPLETLGGDVLREVLRGGLDVVARAGAALVGGHSIDDPEPKYGLAVTGIVDPRVMITNAGGEAAVAAGAHAMTDVTGFGLLGHLHNLARESGVAAEIEAATVPAIGGVQAILEGDRGVSGGSRRNAEYAAGFASFEAGVPEWRRRLVTDATTSGGLLVAVAPHRAGAVPGVVIGRLVEGEAGTIVVRS
jgi:selenide,water dikinase